MNFKKLILRITAVNLLSWFFLELFWFRYHETPVHIGAIVIIITQLIGYFLSAIFSSIIIKEKKEELKITPHNCPGHQWYKSSHGYYEECIVCHAERAKEF